MAGWLSNSGGGALFKGFAMISGGSITLKLYRLQLLFLTVVLLLLSFIVILFGGSWSGGVLVSIRSRFSTKSTERGVTNEFNRNVVEFEGSVHSRKQLRTEIPKMEIQECAWNCTMTPTKPVPSHAPHRDCKANRDLQISTAPNNFTVSDIPKFDVTVYNTCPNCSIQNVRLECGQFASAVLPDPCVFRRCALDDCLLKNGFPIFPMEGLTFSYANTFEYSFKLKPVMASDVLCWP